MTKMVFKIDMYPLTADLPIQLSGWLARIISDTP
jgi:hypothetical protein